MRQCLVSGPATATSHFPMSWQVLVMSLVPRKDYAASLPAATARACLPHWLEAAGWAVALMSDAAAAAMGRRPATQQREADIYSVVESVVGCRTVLPVVGCRTVPPVVGCTGLLAARLHDWTIWACVPDSMERWPSSHAWHSAARCRTTVQLRSGTAFPFLRD